VLKVRWRVNKKKLCKVVEFSATKDNKDPEFDNLHSFDIREKGFKPVFVPSDSLITIAVKCPGANPFCYVYDASNSLNLEDQEYDFST